MAPLIYLCGQMTGLPDLNFPLFADCSAYLRAQGFNILSPHEIGVECEDKSWEAYMVRDLAEVLTKATGGIAVLDSWTRSRGGTWEMMNQFLLKRPFYRVVETPVHKFFLVQEAWPVQELSQSFRKLHQL